MVREIIPVILAKNFLDFKKKLVIIKSLEPAPKWIQIDVVDGKFAPFRTCNNPNLMMKEMVPAGFMSARRRSAPIKGAATQLEIDLMVINPLKHAKAWIKVGAKRILFHVEGLEVGSKGFRDDIWKIINCIKSRNVEVGLSLNPDTPISVLEPFLTSTFFLPHQGGGKRLKIDCVLLLGVNPGKSGQKFQRKVLKKIRALRYLYPTLPIEVDGGVKLSNAGMILKAGATRLAAATAIVNAKNPQKAYKQLLKVANKYR